MKSLDEILVEQTSKESVFVSKEIDYLISTNNTNNTSNTFWFNAVFKEFEIPFEYINYKNNKNRDHLVGKCNCMSALKLLQNNHPDSIFLMFKNVAVKKIETSNIVKCSIKYKSENNYIIKYSMKKGEQHAV